MTPDGDPGGLVQEPDRVARRGHRLPARPGSLGNGLGHVGGVQLGILGVVHPRRDGFLGDRFNMFTNPLRFSLDSVFHSRLQYV